MAIHRDLFPVTKHSVFLNNGAESPLNLRTHERIASYLDTVLTAPHTKPATVREEVREAASSLLGGEACDYALVTSTCAGLGIVANGLDWKEGDNVVVPANEHWNNTFPWYDLQAKGVEVRLVPVGDDLRITAESFAAVVDERTRVVSTAHVQFNSGFRADLRALSALAHGVGALFVVDAIQGAGVVPLDVVADGVDVLACAGFKWLLGMPGTGVLYVNEAARARVRPSCPGMFSAERSIEKLTYFDDARKYESGTIASSLFHGWVGGMRLVREIGVPVIFQRVLHLTDLLIAGLKAKPHVTLLTPVASVEERSAILVITLGSEEANRELCDRLLSNNVVVALRGSSVRVSPNFFNTEEEIQTFLNLL